MKKWQLLLAVVTAFVLLLPAAAQVENGQIVGTVLDPTGAAIPNAKVTVTNTATNLVLNTTSNATGGYSVTLLPPGTYKVTAEAVGFKTKTNSGLTVNAGSTLRADMKMILGEQREVVEVSGEAAQVNTDDSKLAGTVSEKQIASLPLNGRNVYDLIQLSPGAVNVAGVDFENGHNTVVNGLRENFNGFLINGVSNKGLSGGNVTTPIQDSVQEFQVLTLNMSAQYGNSAGSVTNLVTKGGTNSFHGTGWEYFRNDKLDANNFFSNQQHIGKLPLRFNQFGFSLGGPILKDKLFFFTSYQGDRFRQTAPPSNILLESPEWRAAVSAAAPNSVANLLYTTFQPKANGTPISSLNKYFSDNGTSAGNYLCAANYTADPRGSAYLPAKFASIIGYSAADDAGCGTTANSVGVPYQAGTFSRDSNFLNGGIALFNQQTQSLGNLTNGNEYVGRIDYNLNTNNRFYLSVNYQKLTDSFGPCNAACTRGFNNPSRSIFPNGQFNFVHTFSPRVLNEFRAGYAQNNTAINATNPGVPQVSFDDATAGFGSYSGYPQFFKEHIYTYSDLVSISKGNHSFKIGGEMRRNIENSEFNVARPSYYFQDSLFFAADQPYTYAAGVDPGITSGQPAQLATNVRHWRNREYGFFFQDDWKASKKLTLNLGIRYDLYQRHNEENNLATTFIKGSNQPLISNISTGAGWLASANILAGNAGCDSATQIAQAQLAGVCGAGGFAASKTLGKGDYNNFGPRVGFAYDVHGNGKTAIRGGFGVAYEGTLYNPLSNSRWNLPYYSFDSATNFLQGQTDTVVYGPTNPDFTASGAAPTFLGAGTNPGQGVGAQSAGNLTGWNPANPNTAILTGIIFPEGIRDPYVYNDYFGIQHELAPKLVLEVNYVGTIGHKLFRSEDINRIPGGRLPTGECAVDNIGRTVCGRGGSGRINQNYGRLRVWENVVNSNYHSLQVALKKQATRGLTFNVDYTWSHSIDNGSTWHSGATTANGAAGGEGFNTDVTQPRLDRSNSLFDIRQRLVFNYVYELPFYRNQQGFVGKVLGGWNWSGIISAQSGAHWSPYDSRSRKLTGDCSQAGLDAGACINTGGDYNLDAIKNDRPSSDLRNYSGASHSDWANGFGVSANGDNLHAFQQAHFFAPTPGSNGNLGRNVFVGPGAFVVDTTFGKTFKITERFNMQFRGDLFNIFNHTNFLLATAGGGANNKIQTANFGQAGGTLNPRQVQLGLKLTF